MMIRKKVQAIFVTAALAFSIVQPVSAATYKVAAGDSLYTIGNLFNTSSSTIMADNKLTSSTIYPGQALYVSASTYTVQNGDSIYLIAKKFNISMYSLRKANDFWSDMIYAGQKLIIPGQTTSIKTPVVSYTANDIDLLARLIQAEAENQPYSAKVAVGAVVLNRVKAPLYPKTISGVIYEVSGGYHQFTPVVNGTINKPASQQSKDAANAALYGSDPSNGALYYFDDSATNKWLWSKPITARIGNMVYVK